VVIVIFDILRMVAVLVAAMLLGRWFLQELKNAKARGLPWYRPYVSPPGLLIILIIILLPIFAGYLNF
jgi:hypothetical protein